MYRPPRPPAPYHPSHRAPVFNVPPPKRAAGHATRQRHAPASVLPIPVFPPPPAPATPVYPDRPREPMTQLES